VGFALIQMRNETGRSRRSADLAAGTCKTLRRFWRNIFTNSERIARASLDHRYQAVEKTLLHLMATKYVQRQETYGDCHNR